jgi:hypothetical protein
MNGEDAGALGVPLMKTVVVAALEHIPPGYTILQDDEGYFIPVRVLTDRTMEYLTDQRTQDRARFWALGTAIMFLHEYDVSLHK